MHILTKRRSEEVNIPALCSEDSGFEYCFRDRLTFLRFYIIISKALVEKVRETLF